MADASQPCNVYPAFLTCTPHLIRAFKGKCDVVLGDGTVLASRWEHRVSTDLDFSAYGDDFLVPSYIKDVGQTLAEDPHSIQALTVHTRHLSFVCMDTNVSVFTTTSLTHKQSVEQELETDLFLETTEEILAKKLTGRIMRLGEFLVRDADDLCVASYPDTDALAIALTVMSRDQMADIATELKSLVGLSQFTGRNDAICWVRRGRRGSNCMTSLMPPVIDGAIGIASMTMRN